jgi:hypothetical protein
MKVADMTTITIDLPDSMANDLERYTRQHANNPAGVGSSVEDLARYLLSLAETAYRRPGSWEAAALESAGIFDFNPPPLDFDDDKDLLPRLSWAEDFDDRVACGVCYRYTAKHSVWGRCEQLSFWVDKRGVVHATPAWATERSHGGWFTASHGILKSEPVRTSLRRSHPDHIDNARRRPPFVSGRTKTHREKAAAVFLRRSAWGQAARVR